MWGRQILLILIGLSGGVSVAAGLFSFIVELGVVSDFADRTHTADRIMLYEDSTALGGVLGNLFYLFQISLPFGKVLIPVFGILSGIFTGCWAMALAENLNVFPVFIRRLKILRYTAAFVIAMAAGRGIGGLIFFSQRW
ncbi:MAG: stage V sporulation protein AB [Schaedlerella sp.]|nr:stage V sporulation protein AB [Lachnospiraceae bacterium]MDY4201925.1 stage V sporulation protein AB [Schaedlerella sp.]